MKKQLLKSVKHWMIILTGITLMVTNAKAQLTGVKTIPGTYASLSAAISDLNANGVGAGGVTFSINAGYTETLSAPLSVTATGTVSNPIVFQKNGAGANPVITAYTGGIGTPGTAVMDGIWNLSGSDYLTIDGINLMENNANTTGPSRMEYGFALFKKGATDGCQYNTIKNCVITLNRVNNLNASGPMFPGSNGIIVINATAFNATANITVSSANGGNSNNKFYTNTIQNSNNGIVLSGFAAPFPYTLADQNNDIGGAILSTGNTLVNIGGAPFADNAAAGIIVKDQWTFNVSNNTVNNNNGSGADHANILRGIWCTGSNGANGTIVNNTLTLKGAGAVTQLSPIENNAGSSGTGNTINISSNTIINCTYANATSGVFYGIYNTATPSNLIIRNNILTNNSTGATTGNYYSIYSTGGAESIFMINKNTINGVTFTAGITSVIYRGIFSSGSYLYSTLNLDSNVLQNISFSGIGNGEFAGIYASSIVQGCTIRNNTITNMAFNTIGTAYMIYASYVMPTVGAGRTKIVSGNTISDINRKGLTGTLYGYYSASATVAAGNAIAITNNQFNNMRVDGASFLSVLFEGEGATTSPYGPAKSVKNNTITNLNGSAGTITALTVQNCNLNVPASVSSNNITNVTGSGAITGITSATSGSQEFNTNTISNLNTTGIGSSINGLLITSGISNTITNTKIYGLTTSSGVINGINLSGGTVNLYNNLIAELKTANTNNVNAINGINIVGGIAFNMYHNTVYLNATSSGTDFGSAILNILSNAPTITIRNNIFINHSVAKGTGLTVVQQRNSATLTNFSVESDKNLYYAGIPGPSNLIYTDGTSNIETLSGYITFVSPIREASSYTEDVSFISTSGSNSDFLKPNPLTPTLVESGGSSIAGITTDYAGTGRPGSESYTGTGSAPDLGALEGNFTSLLFPMTHDSSNADQITGVLPKGSNNVQILRVRIYAANGSNPLDATSFKFTTTGTTAPSDIVNARLYYTGNSSTFTNTSQYGSTVSAPSGIFYVTGTKKMVSGVNYFWLVYDVSASAAIGNTLDATLDSIKMSGGNYALLNNSPSGSRLIRARLSGNYNIGSGLVSPDYNSINAAFTDLTLMGVSGPVTFTLTDPAYNIASSNITALPITVTKFEGASSVNTVTLRPNNASPVVINEDYTGTIFNLSGVNYFKIDGRHATTLVPRSLIVENDSLKGSIITFIDDASNNRLEYAVFRGASNLNATGVINFSTGILTGNDNNTIDNCHIADALTTPATLIQASGSLDGNLSKYNDNNTISNCELFNFWHASAESNAFKISNGNNNWTISGNSIYQTASRSGTAGYYIFNLNNGGNNFALNGFTIINNFIGGSAPMCGGTPWTITSGTANQNTYFNLGHYITTRYCKNTMANYSITTTSASATGAGLLSFAQYINGKLNIDSNTIGSTTDTNSITVVGASGGAFVPIYSSATAPAGLNSISGNRFGAISVNASGGSTNNFTAISITGGSAAIGFTISNNTIGNNIANNIILGSTLVGAQMLRGIFNSSTTAPVTISDNLIHNLTNLANGTGASQTIGIHCTAGLNTIVNNTVDSLTGYTAQTGALQLASVIGIVMSGSNGSGLISQNKVYALVNTHPTASVHVNGIVFTGGSGDLVSRNFVHSLTTTSSSITSQVNGLITTGTFRLTNNMIRLGIDEAGNSSTLSPIISGISEGAGTVEVYHNTVYIGGSGVGTGTAKSYAFNRTGLGSDIVMNNVFINNRSNASTGGGHFVVGLNNTTDLNLNFNVYHSSGTGDSIGIIGGTSKLTLAEWKTFTAVDASTCAGNPGIINATGGMNSINLHISGTTAAEGQGYGVTGTGVDIDYDGQIRSSLSPIDMGADAGTFTASDLTAPHIAYTPLANIGIANNRTVTATITDATGTYLTSATIPRIYFKKMNAGTWNSSPGTYVSGTKTNSVWNFTIDTTILGGLSNNDSVYYYVVAQDSVIAGNNISSNPSGVVAANVSTVTVHPKPYTYKILPIPTPISGNFNVGVGQTFTSLTGAAGIFNFLNNSVIAGNITVTIKSNTSESGTVMLNQMVESGVGNYTIRVVPDTAIERLLSGAAGPLIGINGADRVIFDGRYAGSGRYLKFSNTASAQPTFNLQNDSHLDTIMYCTVLGKSLRWGDIMFADASATGNDSNAVMYCKLGSIDKTTSRTNVNIGCLGNTPVGGENSENTIAYNEIYGALYHGITLYAPGTGNNWMIYNNYFYQDTFIRQSANPNLPAGTGDHYTINVLAGGGHIIRKNSIGGSDVNRGGVAYSLVPPVGSSGTSIGAIFVNTPSASPVIVDSNSIGNITNAHTFVSTAIFVAGITVRGGNVDVRSNKVGNATPAYPADSIFSKIGQNSMGIFVSGGTLNASGNTVATISTMGLSNVCAGFYFSGGMGNIAKNNVFNVFSQSTGQMPAGMQLSGGSFIIENNTISDIYNTNPSSGNVAAILTGGGSPSIIKGNRIYNIRAMGSVTGTSSPQVYGIQTTATAHLFTSNQISLGNNIGAETRIFGIQDASSSGMNRYYYNSVFVNGNTASGANNSYCFQKTSSGSNLLVWNNIFYNKRTTLGNGSGYAISTLLSSTAGITKATFNYNLYVVNDTNKVLENGVNVPNGVWDINNVYYKPFSTYNTNWIESSANLPADSLFENTTSGNLGINTINTQSWYANGKGCAIDGEGNDFNNTSIVRSTTITNGSTDIGSIEFTTDAAILPMSAIGDKIPAYNDSTTYYYANRPVAKVVWGLAGTLPTLLDVKFYSGMNPSNTFPGSTFMNAYWDIVPTGGSGYNSSVIFLQDSAILGSVNASANIRVARYVGPGTQWAGPFATTVNNITGTMTVAGLSTFGIFTGTNGLVNPLPVELLSFTATAINKDVKLNWRTATEWNNSGFTVERSVNGKIFEEINSVKSTGNHNTVTSYEIMDNEAFSKHNVNILYYRLRQQDADGQYSYSAIEAVLNDTKTTVGFINMYPNPFNNTITLKWVSETGMDANLTVVDITGKELFTIKKQFQKGNNQILIDEVSILHAGIYFMTVETGDKKQVLKLIKE
jgi:hypothetical protein